MPANVRKVKRPKWNQTEMKVYTREDFPVLLAALEHEPLIYRVLVNLALVSGLRQGELLGLTWDNVDLDTSTITVTQSLSYTITEGLQLKEPKTKGSKAQKPLQAKLSPCCAS
ncbi:tyrosine-type recombinase/integrase [Paenibacillus montanisoli]